MATKVVGVVLVGVAAAVLIARLFVEGRSWRKLIVGSASFAAGLATPLLLVELWRWYWLGNTEYREWWDFQLFSIRSQSGAAPLQVQAALPAKIAHHLGILRNQLGFGSIATGLFLLAPLLSLTCGYLAGFSMEQRRRCRWFLLGLVLLVLFYFPWWLAIVPSDKAWLRYIYIGLIALAMISSVGLVANVRVAFAGGRRPLLRATSGSLAVLLVALYGSLVLKALQVPISFGKDEETRRTIEAAQLISRLPRDAAVLAFGWYAAPSVQIHTQRPFMDLTDWPIGRLTGRPAYLVADRPSLVTGILNRVLARYPHRPLLQANRFAQVYAVDFANPVNPFGLVNPEQTASHVTFSKGEYPYTMGMEPFNPVGGRFIESDSEILLRYGGEPALQLVGYMDAAQPTHYRWAGPMEGRVVLGRCPPMPFRFERPGWRDLRLPLSCRPPEGQPVRVRILLDNVFDWPILLKDRQRAMLLASIGFLGETPAQ